MTMPAPTAAPAAPTAPPEAPPAGLPPVDAAAPPEGKPKAKEPEDLKSEIARGFAALDRKREANRREREQIAQEKASIAQERKAIEEARAEKARLADLTRRANEGDEDAQKELGVSFDDLTLARLDPESAKKKREEKRALTETEKRIKQLEEQVSRANEAAKAAAIAREQAQFVAVAKQLADDVPELEIFEPGELVDLANKYMVALPVDLTGEQFYHQLARAIAEGERPRIQKVVAWHERRAAKAAPPAPPAKAGKPGERPEPSTISGRSATIAASVAGDGNTTDYKAEAASKLKRLMAG